MKIKNNKLMNLKFNFKENISKFKNKKYVKYYIGIVLLIIILIIALSLGISLNKKNTDKKNVADLAKRQAMTTAVKYAENQDNKTKFQDTTFDVTQISFINEKMITAGQSVGDYVFEVELQGFIYQLQQKPYITLNVKGNTVSVKSEWNSNLHQIWSITGTTLIKNGNASPRAFLPNYKATSSAIKLGKKTDLSTIKEISGTTDGYNKDGSEGTSTNLWLDKENPENFTSDNAVSLSFDVQLNGKDASTNSFTAIDANNSKDLATDGFTSILTNGISIPNDKAYLYFASASGSDYLYMLVAYVTKKAKDGTDVVDTKGVDIQDADWIPLIYSTTNSPNESLGDVVVKF